MPRQDKQKMKWRRNKREEEQKGALLCTEHIRGGAAGQWFNEIGSHTHTQTYLIKIRVLTPSHTHTQTRTHSHTHMQTLIDPVAAEAGRKA